MSEASGTALLEAMVRGGAVSAAAGCVAVDGQVVWTGAAGLARRSPARRASPGTRFDLASLTKPFVATLAVTLDSLGLLHLDLPVGEVFPSAHPRLARKRLVDLLSHRAGLRAWAPLYRRCRTPQEAQELLLGGELLGAGEGTYSDLGPILWAMAAERCVGRSFIALLREQVLRPLGICGVMPLPGPRQDVAECHLGNSREVELAASQGVRVALRERVLWGEPQDGNARFLGGLSGHAGLFGSAKSLWLLAREWLLPGKILDPVRVAEILGGSGPHLFGWARPQAFGGAGTGLSPTSFGHTGFTGGSLWVDPEHRRIHVLLAHRCSVKADLKDWRRRFHATFDSKSAPMQPEEER